MVMVRALLVSPRVLVPPLTLMVRTPQVSHVFGVGVVGGADGEGVAGGVPLTVLVMLMVGCGVGDGSGYGSARGGHWPVVGCCCWRCLSSYGPVGVGWRR